jgi:hypothetical protein
MLERLENLPTNVVGVRASGRLSKDDYQGVVQPMFEDLRRQGQRQRFIYQFAPEFEEIEASAAWQDLRVGIQYLRLLERCAVVTDVDWLRQASQFFGAMLPFPVRVFGNAEFAEAVKWAMEPTGPKHLSHELIEDRSLLVVEPHGRLRAEDLDAVAMTVDPWIEEHGPLQGVVVKAQEFSGWENLGSFVRQIRFVRDHHRKVKRIAWAGGGRLAHLAPRLAEHFVEAEIRHFEGDRISDAMDWAGGAQAQA